MRQLKVMKTLYLVRHAKSSWKNPDLTDKERPLNKRGKKDAPLIGTKLNEMRIQPELIISSDVVRAKKTAYMIAKEIGYDKDNIVLTDEIYEASTMELLNVFKQLNQEFKSIMLFGHNPALTGLHNYLTDHYIDNIPTCGLTAIRFENQWADIKEKSGKFLFYIYPKLYKK